MTDREFEGKHPRATAGRFAEKHQADPGAGVLPPARYFPVWVEFNDGGNGTISHLVDAGPVLADMTPAEMDQLRWGGFDLYAEAVARGLDTPPSGDDYVITVNFTDAALDEWIAGNSLAEPDDTVEAVDEQPATDMVLRRHRIDPASIPTGRNEVWAYADACCAETGDTLDTFGREQLWSAIVSHANSAWVVGLSERYRMLRDQPEG